MMSTKAGNSDSADTLSPAAAKFAVVRLKPGDNMLGLFQLLIHHGFGEVSFVNNLTETIFPAISRSEINQKQNFIAPENEVKILDSSKDDDEKFFQTVSKSITDRFHLTKPIPVSASTPASIVPKIGVENRKESSFYATSPGENPTGISQKRPALELNLNLLSQAAATVAGPPPSAASSSAFSTMPTNFLGLPTIPGLNNASATTTAANIAALSEASTPPYSLSNFFASTNLPTTTASLTHTPQNGPQNGPISHYSSAIMNAAAAAALIPKRPVPTLVGGGSLSGQNFPAVSAAPQISRPQVQPHQQQRLIMNQQPPPHQNSFPFSAVAQQQQLRQQHILAPPMPQQSLTKLSPQKSPAASPGSNSSASSTHSAHNAAVAAAMPPGCATTQLRQRGQRSYAEDPSLYVSCRLCKNKIMGSRISNLTNHVRRHSSMKQFQCCYCDYTHNEMAKVRLHMLHNHKDKDSQPIDNLSPEMQASWDLLMKECFPDHCQQQHHQQSQHQQQSQSHHNSSAISPTHQLPLSLANSNVASILSRHLQWQTNQTQQLQQQLHQAAVIAAAAASAQLQHQRSCDDEKRSENATSPESTTSSIGAPIIAALSPEATTPPALQSLDQQHQNLAQQNCVIRCVECGLYVNPKLKARHIRKCHLQCLLPFVCSMCGYDHSEHSKVKVHICLKHDDDPIAHVVTRDLSTYAEQLIPDYFPDHVETKINSQEIIVDDTASVEPVITPSTDSVSSPMQHQAAAINDASVTKSHEIPAEKKKVKILCDVCQKRIPKCSLKRHARKHLSTASFEYFCDICLRYRCPNRSKLIRHLKIKHSIESLDSEVRILRRPTISKNVGPGRIMKYAIRRCFQSQSTKNSGHGTSDVVKLTKAIIRRYRRHQLQQQKRRCINARRAESETNARRGNEVKTGPMNYGKLKIGKKRSMRTAKLPEATLLAPAVVGLESLKPELKNSMSDLFRMCPLCAHWISTDQLASHLQNHVQSIQSASYRCNLCDFMASDPLLIKTHFVQAHQSQSELQLQHQVQQQLQSQQLQSQQQLQLLQLQLQQQKRLAAAADG